jgi:hypothetical protein
MRWRLAAYGCPTPRAARPPTRQRRRHLQYVMLQIMTEADADADLGLGLGVGGGAGQHRWRTWPELDARLMRRCTGPRPASPPCRPGPLQPTCPLPQNLCCNPFTATPPSAQTSRAHPVAPHREVPSVPEHVSLLQHAYLAGRMAGWGGGSVRRVEGRGWNGWRKAADLPRRSKPFAPCGVMARQAQRRGRRCAACGRGLGWVSHSGPRCVGRRADENPARRRKSPAGGGARPEGGPGPGGSPAGRRLSRLAHHARVRAAEDVHC